MSKRPTVILGMSGGVDSSVAASLLVKQGYDVRGVTLKVWEDEDETTAATKRWQERGCCKVGVAKHVAELLGTPHEVVDVREAFSKNVIDDFVSGYLAGTTPNPCVRCNERVKFGFLYQIADRYGADYLATGHYAQITRDADGLPELHRGADPKKDQSYFLYRISPSWLPRVLFPVGGMQKSDVWERATSMGLPADELRESQEICFVTQGDYRSFLMTEAPEAEQPGPFIDRKGNYLGQHKGIAFYTPGQRKGLGLATGKRLYVHQVIPETGAVVVGSEEGLITPECRVGELTFLNRQSLHDGEEVEVKIRYASPPTPGILRFDESHSLRVQFLKPQRAISPGQSAVFYKGSKVIGGGIIQASPSHKPEEKQGQIIFPAGSVGLEFSDIISG